MFAPSSIVLRRKLCGQTSGSARRRARERKKAEFTRAEGERLACEKRARRHADKIEQQRQAREELASYEPWGRAGGGAPNPGGVRYSNLRGWEIFPEDELKGTCPHEASRRHPSPRRRRRTPLRLREDPQVCYAENLRQAVDNDIRYRNTSDQQKEYKEVLDDLVDKKIKANKDQRKRDKDYERKMRTIDGPWGRPGPGGITWRHPRDIGLNFSKSMGWTDNEIFNKIQGDHHRRKRSSLTLPKVKTVDDTPNKENKHSSIEKLPDINKPKSKESPQEHRETISYETITTNTKNKDSSSSNGKGKRSSRKKKFVKRLPNGERIQKIVSADLVDVLPDEEECVSEKKKPTPEATILRLTGGIELVPLLARRRQVGARTLPSSDVTRPPEQPCQWREMLNMDYLKELKHQMRVKCEKREEKRLDSAESIRVHHATWAALWGRPGHGAPQQRGRYARHDLARLLYVQPLAPA